MSCPCGLGSSYQTCCAPYHEGLSVAPTAEILMRSRYSAFAQHRYAYLVATVHPRLGEPGSEADLVAQAGELEWTGLAIERVIAGGPGQARGVVAFTARFERAGVAGRLVEESLFVAEEGRWYYVDGGGARALPGRNDPCLCGSGRKFKKCCEG